MLASYFCYWASTQVFPQQDWDLSRIPCSHFPLHVQNSRLGRDCLGHGSPQPLCRGPSVSGHTAGQSLPQPLGTSLSPESAWSDRNLPTIMPIVSALSPPSPSFVPPELYLCVEHLLRGTSCRLNMGYNGNSTQTPGLLAPYKQKWEDRLRWSRDQGQGSKCWQSLGSETGKCGLSRVGIPRYYRGRKPHVQGSETCLLAGWSR